MVVKSYYCENLKHFKISNFLAFPMKWETTCKQNKNAVCTLYSYWGHSP